VSERSGLSRGDRNRNQRLARLRELVPAGNAIVGVDLADVKQAIVVTDHDSRVLARRRVLCRAWQLGQVLDWAVAKARAAGFASVTVACEPTGHRWRVLDQLAAERGLSLVCVQPLRVWRAREAEDLTWDKSDPKDAVIIARLAAQLCCYEPERSTPVYARLRHLGARRHQLITDAAAGVQQLRDLLECVWPGVLDAAGAPFRSASWCAALAVVLDRCDGDLKRVRRMGAQRFLAAVRAELPRWGATRPRLGIITAVFDALTDPTGVLAQRPGALQRAAMVIQDWHTTRTRLVDTEQRMVAVLDELGLTELVCSIPGLSAVGAAAILAETGDLTPLRYSTGGGQICRPVPSRQCVGLSPGQDKYFRSWPACAAAGGLAGGVGRHAQQRRPERTVHPLDYQTGQPTRRPTGPRRVRRRPAALAPRHRYPTRGVGSGHRRR
jgi:hypothetical protein